MSTWARADMPGDWSDMSPDDLKAPTAMTAPDPAEAERAAEARIVAWLRSQAWFYAELERWQEMADLYERIAAAIEAGEHRKEPRDG